MGGTLIYTGKLGQAPGFSTWASGQGQAVVKSLAERQRFCMLGRHRKARSILWSELDAAATSGTLGAALQDEAARYPRLPGELAQIVEPDKFVADWRPFVIPRFLVNAVALRGMSERLASSHVLTRLQGGEALRDYFLRQFVDQMDAAFSKIPFSIKAPAATAHEWVVIDFDLHFDWQHTAWSGHYYLVQTKAVEISRERAASLAQSLSELKAMLGRLRADEVRVVAQAWQAWFDGRDPRLFEVAARMG
ncbi:hypothetical protein [Azohydromonas caseinilytica]|uniref:Uncharacterized protein n=1 Tax=Azohydromonas caseinilytica TaxID=2728836 RepID=A0A848FBF6_9BURK|nr:hypothetical protein [Azohydromonas caseinilytica]NML15653.1 hypothetical protein [Azohydromonas caseinilytica]